MIADVMWEIEMWQALNGTPEQKAGFRAKLEAEEREAGLAKA